MSNQLGKYAFIIGVILAVVLGLAADQLGTATDWLWSLLVVLGLVVGFLNVSGKESRDFLWVTVALVLVAYAASSHIGMWADVEILGPYLLGVFTSLVTFVVPASVVVALRVVWDMAKGH